MLVTVLALFLLALISLFIVYVGNDLEYHKKLSFLSTPITTVGLCSIFLFVVLLIVELVFVTSVYYDRKAINSMFNTSYTMDEVRLFRNEIKARHETKVPITSTE